MSVSKHVYPSAKSRIQIKRLHVRDFYEVEIRDSCE